jgi:hypothetical protein
LFYARIFVLVTYYRLIPFSFFHFGINPYLSGAVSESILKGDKFIFDRYGFDGEAYLFLTRKPSFPGSSTMIKKEARLQGGDPL